MVDQPSISVIDDDATRPDLAERRETKYVFAQHDVATLRNVLRRSCRPIVHAGPVSTVRSLYFDDPDLGACRANFDGIGIRSKTRLRWYDREQAADGFFLEVKWRRYRVCGKHRTHLTSSMPLEDASFGALHAALRRSVPDHHRAHLLPRTEPVVLVEYRREHFGTLDGRARLTLDYDIRFYPQLGRRRLSRRFTERLAGVVIIESKSPMADALALRNVLAPLRTRATRFSKYVTGCQRLGYVSAG